MASDNFHADDHRSRTHPIRRKPWYRFRNIVLFFFGVILVGAIWLTVLAISAANAKPMSSGPTAVDYGKKLNELNIATGDALYGPLSAEEKGRAHGFEDIGTAIAELRKLEEPQAQIGDKREDGKAVLYYDAVFPDYEAGEAISVETEAQKARAVIATISGSPMQTALDRIVQDRRYIRPPLSGTLHEILLPELGSTRALARVNGARMYIASKNAAAPDAKEMNESDKVLVMAFEQNLAIARLLGQDPILISRLVAFAVSARATSDTRNILAERRLSEPTLQALIDTMARQGGVPNVSTALQGERAMVLDFVQRTHSDNGRGSGTLIPSEFAKMQHIFGGSVPANVSRSRALNITGLLFPSRAEVESKVNEYFDLAVAESAKSRLARDPAVESSLENYADKISKRHVIIQLLLPALSRAMRAPDQHQLDLAGTRLMLEIELIRARTGSIPKDLSTVDPALTKDPFTDQLFGYRVLSTPDEYGRDYLLYGLGVDGVDNQGTPNPASAFIALTKPALPSASGKPNETSLGYDFIINQPPRRAKAPPTPAPTPEQTEVPVQ